MAITITIRKDGPYVVEGDLAEVRLIDHEGNSVSIEGKPRVSLCRCGASVTKPFCDGTHKQLNLQRAETPRQEIPA